VTGVGDAGFGRAFRAFRFTSSLRNAVPASLTIVPPNPWPGDAIRGRTMLGNVIALGGESISVEGSPWSVAASRPWFEALHSFAWLRDLRAVGGDAARRHARLLTVQWLDRKPRRGDIGLRADIAGARIGNWIAFHDFFCASADDRFRARFFASLSHQSRGLSKALPGEFSGAPLLLAIKGLLSSALCVDGGEQRFAQAERLLLRELARQVLTDGVHAQRCPAVHAEMLAALIDMRALYNAARIMMPDALRQSIDRMVPALRFFRHGDGGLALFNGGQEGEALLLDTILTQADARARPMKRAVAAGFDRMSLGRGIVIVDSGTPAAAGLDRGAHAGIGGFEMSVGRQRFIVNCGAHPGDGPWRKALAATAAHSTLTVADTNQFELIEGGGVRRRPSVDARRQDASDGMLLEISHNGYAGLGLVHRRRLRLGDGGEELSGEDALLGSTPQRFTIRFHLHPDVHASLTGGGKTALLQLGDGSGWRFRVDAPDPSLEVDLSLDDSVYAGSGSVPRRSSALVVSGRTRRDRDTVLRWAFRREKRPEAVGAE
jgi:uncharacterized heparinase superfamily protein